jgi:hypothetical protein
VSKIFEEELKVETWRGTERDGALLVEVRHAASKLTYAAWIGPGKEDLRPLRVDRVAGDAERSERRPVLKGFVDQAVAESVAAMTCHRLLRAEVRQALAEERRLAETALRMDKSLQAARREKIPERNNETKFYRRAAREYIALERLDAARKKAERKGA